MLGNVYANEATTRLSSAFRVRIQRLNGYLKARGAVNDGMKDERIDK